MASGILAISCLFLLRNPERALKFFGLAFLTFVILLRLTWFIRNKTRSMRKPPDAARLLNEDSRRPVLYLRAFRNAGADTIRTPLIEKSTTDEERLAVVMNQIGPFVAISETDAGKTDFGAARLSVSHNEWQGKVLELMLSAQLIVIRIDPLTERWGRFQKDTHQYHMIKSGFQTLKDVPKPNDFIPIDIPPSIWWEIEQAMKTKPDRTLLYLPFTAKKIERDEVYKDITPLLEKFVNAKLPLKIGGAEFICFKADGTAYVLDKKGIRMFGIVNSYGKVLEPFLKDIGIGSVRTKVDYFRIAEFVLRSIQLLMFIVFMGGILLVSIVDFISKNDPEYGINIEIRDLFFYF